MGDHVRGALHAIGENTVHIKQGLARQRDGAQLFPPFISTEA